MKSNAKARSHVAVIGAGMAGVTCARRLTDAGFTVTVLEKSRGVGGRLATRRIRENIMFDHGAQYLSVRSGPFQSFMDEAFAQEAAAPWRPHVAGALNPEAAEDWFVGIPAMNSLVKPAARDIEIKLQTKVAGIVRDGGVWRIECENAADNRSADYVVCTAPAPQTLALTSASAHIQAVVARVVMSPCWAAMIAFENRIDAPFDVWRGEAGDVVWLARNSGKPGRNRDADCWVAHANAAWSKKHVELDSETAAQALKERVLSILDVAHAQAVFCAAHRWRYAFVETPLEAPFIEDETKTMFSAGDWCLGARIEDAFLSGRAVAAKIVQLCEL